MFNLLPAVIGAGASLISGNKQAKAAKSASAAQTAAAERLRGDLQPFRQAGERGVDALMTEMGLGADGSYAPPAAPDYSLRALSSGFEASPGYQYMVDEMMRGVNNSAAARGMTMSGATLKELQRNAGQLANQDYWQYVNAQRQAAGDTENSNQRRVGNLQWLSGMGQNAAAQQGQAGMNAATNAGQLSTQGAAASASGIMGASNAVNQGFQNYWNQQQQTKMMDLYAGRI